MHRRTLARVALFSLGIALVGALVVQARGSAARREVASSAMAAERRSPVSVRAEGRVSAYPGAKVEVGTDFAGTLRRVTVEEQDQVRKGQLLAEFAAEDLRAELEESRARSAEAEADLRLAETEIERARRLVSEAVSPRQELDRRLRDRDAALARRETARAAVARLEAVLAKTRIVAPIDGVVIAREAHAGETLDRGDRILTIADLSRVRIEAEVDEYDSGRVAVGAPVAVRAEGYEGTEWRGRVEEIPDTVTIRAQKPQDPGRPTDTRVLLVKVGLGEAIPLKLGQRVEVAIAVSETVSMTLKASP